MGPCWNLHGFLQVVRWLDRREMLSGSIRRWSASRYHSLPSNVRFLARPTIAPLTIYRFYPRQKMAWRIGLFYCAAPLSGAFGGLLATGLAQIKVGGYNKWPW